MGTPKLLDPPPGAARRARRPPRSRDTGGLRELVPGRGPHGRGAVVRSRLVAPLVQAPRPLVVLVAPAGWGKSTVLAQWRRVEPRPLRAVSLSRSHDDAAALEASVAAALADLGAAVPEGDVPEAFARLGPCVLVLDGLEVLRAPGARDLVARLADRVPAGGTLALASRTDLDLPLARRRSRDDVIELRARRLAMTRLEAAQVLRSIEPRLTDRDAERLHELTQGWPGALRLAARAVAEQDGAPSAVDGFGGEDAVVTDYVREEVLSALAPEDRAFLRRISILARITGRECDAALARRGSAPVLRRLSRSGVPLVPLDRTEREYRMNPLLADALRAELRHVEPEVEPDLHRRLSRWHEAEGDQELAIEHAVSARDARRAADLLAVCAAGLAAGGRAELVRTWLRRLGDTQVARHPALALAAAVGELARGEAGAADHWSALALQSEGAGDPALIRWAAGVVRGLCAPQDACAARGEPPRAADGPWRSLAHLADGTAALLAGRGDAAARSLDEGARTAIIDAPLTRALCLAELAVLALDRGDGEECDAFAARACSTLDRAACAGDALAVLPIAVRALCHAGDGRRDTAAGSLDEASRRIRRLDDAPRWYGALVRVLLARTAVHLGDAAEARRLLSEARVSCRRLPAATALHAWIQRASALVDEYATKPGAPSSGLTQAELRVLRLLPSHLTFREIGAELHVSANTVKTQAHAIYRKLDARSRSEAVARAAAAGLVDAPITGAA